MTSIAAALLAAAGCGALPPAGFPPLVVAHRSGTGNWPENSRTAVLGAVAAGYPGIEFDLVLTSDRVPVLSHDAALNPQLCTRADGTALGTDPVYIKDLTLQELHAGYRCGGVPHPDHPSAQVVADMHLTLDELIAAVEGHPDLLLHFDVKFEPERTLDATTFADEILGRWSTSGLPNPWYMSSSQPEFIGIATERGARVSYTLPRNVPGAGSTGSAVIGEVLAKIGVADQIGLARQSGATGLNVAYQLVDRAVVDAARREGLTVQVWTVNAPDLLDFYCRWPMDTLITDYPERASCL
ncbi:MAG TPA: glycerophosphodiester phosphodiesterase family protein [Myxococcales bacterium]|nr:glycerophosphodiester phosphodiesterase family protein [Myxococcales bacterium]